MLESTTLNAWKCSRLKPNGKCALQELVTVIRDTTGVRDCQVVLESEASGRDHMIVRLLPEQSADGKRLASTVR